MNDSSLTGRYAPSPTGALHLGNLRTALAAYLHIRSRGGRFLLRVEDLDTPRVKPGAEERQLADLRALGITWDEEPLRQSERGAIYDKHFRELVDRGLAYPCFCSRKDIKLATSAPHREDAIAGYPGTCSSIPSHESQSRIAAGEQHCWRLRVAGAPREFNDGFVGHVDMDLAKDGGDFVIKRADGIHAYHLACAVDDALSGVTEVLRGADLLDSGLRQQWILQCLGLPVPQYFHIPLMLAPDGKRLSKRDGADDLQAFHDKGFDEAAVVSYLVHTLGQCGRGERSSLAEMARLFDLGRLPRVDVKFDAEKLAQFSRHK